MKNIIFVFLILLILIGGGYLIYTNYFVQEDTQITESEDEDENNTGLANPASTYCEENGGTLKIEDEEDGQVGYCYFEDDSFCEEWAYYRGECEV